MMLDRPLYRMVAEQIEARISEGRYAVGTALPTEPVFAQEFKVSRITIRQALGLLKRRGILGSRSGLGTFVRNDAIDHTSMRLSGSLRQLVYYAAATRYTPLCREVVVPPAEVAGYFEKEGAERTICFSGKRGLPRVGNFCFEQIYVAEEFGRGLDNTRLGSSPLFNRLEELNGVKVSEVKQIITAVSARATLARELEVKHRAAVLKAVRIYRLTDRRVVEVSLSHYDPMKFDYIMDLLAE